MPGRTLLIWLSSAALLGDAFTMMGPAPCSRRDLARAGFAVGTVLGLQPGPARATLQDSYDSYSKSYNNLDGGALAERLGIEELRAAMTSRANGRVLEVAVGTGLNLGYYDTHKVSAIDGVDLSKGMLQQAQARAGELGISKLVTLRQMDVEKLDFPDGSFDSVVDTFGLCVFPNPTAALREMKRVCKPGGRVLLLENSRSSAGGGIIGAYQDATAGAIASLGGKGCVWNQDVEGLAKGAGLHVTNSVLGFAGLFRVVECRA
ncbi:unnamed protein product [Chrysoparadoxa australica]